MWSYPRGCRDALLPLPTEVVSLTKAELQRANEEVKSAVLASTE